MFNIEINQAERRLNKLYEMQHYYEELIRSLKTVQPENTLFVYPIGYDEDSDGVYIEYITFHYFLTIGLDNESLIYEERNSDVKFEEKLDLKNPVHLDIITKCCFKVDV